MKFLLIPLLALTVCAADEYKQIWNNFWAKVHSDPSLESVHQKWIDTYDNTGLPPELYPDFNCDKEIGKSPENPTNVNVVRPGDIQVIGAVGDSITAGFGLDAEEGEGELGVETRGESWSIGGNENITKVLTVANVLKEFNGGLFGASKHELGSSCGRPNECAGLNRAISGAINTGIPGQMQNFIDEVNDHADAGNIDIDNDWKLVTILIGGNDLCRHCNNVGGNTRPEQYFESIQEAVLNVRENLPRTIVNIAIMFDVTPIDDMETSPDYNLFCRTAHAAACGCAVNPGEGQEDLILETQMQYWQDLHEWINIDGTFDGDEDFTVVLQPHMGKQGPPYIGEEFDLSYFAPDCFHPNRKGHQVLALYLYNTMMLPVCDKPFSNQVDPDVKLEYICPTEDFPFIATRGNSGDTSECDVPIPEDDLNRLRRRK